VADWAGDGMPCEREAVADQTNPVIGSSSRCRDGNLVVLRFPDTGKRCCRPPPILDRRRRHGLRSKRVGRIYVGLWRGVRPMSITRLTPGSLSVHRGKVPTGPPGPRTGTACPRTEEIFLWRLPPHGAAAAEVSDLRRAVKSAGWADPVLQKTRLNTFQASSWLNALDRGQVLICAPDASEVRLCESWRRPPNFFPLGCAV